MKRFFHKLAVFLKMIKVYRNWPSVVLYRLNVRPEPMIVLLRDGSKFKVRDRRRELSDAYVINEAYLYGIHDKLLPFLADARVGLDIGAFLGSFSVFAAKRSKAKIFAFEPAPNNLKLLNENIAINHLEGRVIPVQAAVAGASGTINLHIPQNSGLVTTKRKHLEIYGADDGPIQVMRVRAMTLADVFRENNITFCDFIKMDCEGCEYDIIFNAPKSILERIGFMTIECHKDGSIEELMDFLRKNKFEVVRPTKEFGEIFCENLAPRKG